MKNKIFLSVVICIFLSTQANGQSTSDYQNTFFEPQISLPQLPEVAGFKRYGDIPVGEYTGVPDISIPLYTMRQGTLELPVTLSYHASGIKVEQEATWVGLGWDLLAGASIVVEPVGEFDQITGPFDDPLHWNNFQLFVQDWIPNRKTENLTDPCFGVELEWMWFCRTNSYPLGYDQYITTLFNGKWGRTEPDVFSGSLPNGTNFKFILHPFNDSRGNYTPIMVEKAENLIISYEMNIVRIKDSDGITYIYEAADYYSQYILSYRLKSITSKEGHSIRFNYSAVYESSLPSIHEYYTLGAPYRPPLDEFLPRRSFSTWANGYGGYLQSIVSDMDSVSFETGSREDRAPGTSGKLVRMSVTNKLTSKKVIAYVFDYDYFVGVNKGGDGLNDRKDDVNYNTNISENVRKKRLKLVSLTKVDNSNNIGEKHTFTYNEAKPLPYKTSFSRDYWGYYNGAENASTLISPYKHTLLPDLDRAYNDAFPAGLADYPAQGAIRNSSSEYITAGMLKSITYPTGGSVEFEFEPHTFSNRKILSKEAVDSYNSRTNKMVSNYTAEGCNQSENFTVSYRQTLKLHVKVHFGDAPASQLIGYGANILSIGTNGVSIVKSMKITQEDVLNRDPYTGRPGDPITDFDRTDTVTLDQGNYVIVAGGAITYYDANHYHPKNVVEATVGYRESPFDFNAWPSAGAGVRVKAITKKNSDNVVSETIRYTYEDVQGKSSGKLLTPLNMVKSREIYHIHWDSSIGNVSDNYNINVISSSPTGILPGQGRNIPVGYSRVVKVINNSSEAGKIVSEYENLAAENIGFGYNFISFPNYNNGALIRRTIYSSGNEFLKKEQLEYETNDVIKNMFNLSVEDTYYGNTSNTCFSPLPAYLGGEWKPRFRISLYPSVSYRIDLKRRTETSYFGNDSVSQSVDYLYNKYHQVSTITHNTDNPSSSYRETFLYPSDLSSYPYSNMKAWNIISPVAWYSKTRGNSTTTIQNSYADWEDNFSLLSTLEQSGPVDYRMLTYKYDPKYNPVEVTYQNALSDVYLWGYNYSYVIAHLKNTTYDSVKSRLGDNLTSLCSANAPDITLLNSLRTLFPECEVTTWLYEPSFGVKQQTDSQGLTTYYEYDAFGRLNRTYIIENGMQKTIQTYDYHYKDQQ